MPIYAHLLTLSIYVTHRTFYYLADFGLLFYDHQLNTGLKLLFTRHLSPPGCVLKSLPCH